MKSVEIDRNKRLRDQPTSRSAGGRASRRTRCSVAVDLRISDVVDVPNYVVSALLPDAIFTD